MSMGTRIGILGLVGVLALGFVWFNYDKSGTNEADWMLDSDPLSASTFASLAKGSQWGFHINP